MLPSSNIVQIINLSIFIVYNYTDKYFMYVYIYIYIYIYIYFFFFFFFFLFSEWLPLTATTQHVNEFCFQ